MQCSKETAELECSSVIQGALEKDGLCDRTKLPETILSRLIEPFLCRVGQWSSLLWPILVMVITVNVLLRHLIGKGFIEFEEMQWHIYAVGFMCSLAWVMQMDGHVRIDVLSGDFSFRSRCWIELFGIVCVLLPFLVVVVWFSVPFVAYSVSINEVSEAPGGLPFRWMIKSVLPLGFLLLVLASVSRLSRVVAALSSGVMNK